MAGDTQRSEEQMTADVLLRRSLRDVAEQIERSTGMSVEIIGGEIVMSPTPRGKHNGIVTRIQWQLMRHLPGGLVVMQTTSIGAQDGEDYATPDLVALPIEFGDSDQWLAEPDTVELVLEVVSVSNAPKDTTLMPMWYSQQEIPLFLLIDPRDGSWVMYSVPRTGEYQGTLHGKFGEPIPLPAPFGITIDTADLPIYAC